jgi:hypothetical protein
MANPIEAILSAVHGSIRARPLDWTEVANAIAQVARDESAEGEAALVELIKPENVITVAVGELPHSQSPQDMLRSAAIEALWHATGDKYSALCVQVAAASDSPIVKRLVAARFPEAAAAAAKAPPQ